MSRLTTLSTILGLAGLVLAMLTALAGGAIGVIALGVTMLVLGFMGAVIGAAAYLGRAWDAAR